MATFGNPIQDQDFNYGVSGVYVTRFTAPAYGRTVSFKVFFKWGVKPFRALAVVYEDNNGVRGKLLAYGQIAAQTEDGEIELTIDFFLDEGKPYHFGFCTEKSVWTRGTSGATGQTARDGQDNYPNPPSEFGSPTQLYNQQLFLIVNYEPSDPPALEISILPEQATVFLGDSLTLEATTTGGKLPITIEWFIENTLALTGATFNFTPTEEGTYFLHAKAKDANGIIEQSGDSQIEVVPKPPRPPPIYSYGVKRTSEIRGMFLNGSNMNNPNMEKIANVCENYGINTLIVETGSNCSRYPSAIVGRCAGLTKDYVQEAIDACHPRGIKVYVSMNVLMGAYIGDGKEKRAVTHEGFANWMCPTRPFSREHLVALVKELFRNHPDLDGFMFDYLRYEPDMCYCEFCKERFIADTGLTDVEWFTDVHSGGKYRNQFFEWRVKPINELLELMRNAILEVKSTCEFTAAVWRWIPGHPQYWRMWLGQDSAYWVSQGWLDWICPMIYVDNPATLESSLLELREGLAGGEDGLIPVPPFIDLFVDATSTPSNFAERVNMLRSINADGFIVWTYGGEGSGASYPSITDYFDLIENIPIFGLHDISWKKEGENLVVTWKTNYPASSKVEYSPKSMFETVRLHQPSVNFDYYKVNHIEGTIVEDPLKRTEHSMSIPLASGEVFFRLSSRGSLTASTEEFYSADTPPTEPEEPTPPTEGTIPFLLLIFVIFLAVALIFSRNGKKE